MHRQDPDGCAILVARDARWSWIEVRLRTRSSVAPLLRTIERGFVSADHAAPRERD
jgi:hypothetical protein